MNVTPIHPLVTNDYSDSYSDCFASKDDHNCHFAEAWHPEELRQELEPPKLDDQWWNCQNSKHCDVSGDEFSGRVLIAWAVLSAIMVSFYMLVYVVFFV